MASFVRAFLDNLVLMQVLLPLVGAVLVATSARFGAAAVRRTAYTNCCLVLVLAATMVATYDPAAAAGESFGADVQMTSRLPIWPLTGPRVPGVPAFGVDGLSLWLLAAVPVAMLPALSAARFETRTRPAARYALLLVTQGALAGAFAARDAIVWCASAEIAAWLLFVQIGRQGREERRPAAQRFLAVQATAGAAILIGTTGLCVGAGWMRAFDARDAGSVRIPAETSLDGLARDVPQLVESRPERRGYWDAVGPGLFLLLALGCAVRAPLFPLHTWFAPAAGQASTATGIVLAALGTQLGWYGFARLVVPVLPLPSLLLADSLLTVARWGTVFCGLLVLAQGDVRKGILSTIACRSAFAMAGLFALDTAAWQGAVAGQAAGAVAAALALWLLGHLERRHGTVDREAYGGLWRTHPRWTLLWAAAIAALVGLPGLGSYGADLLVVFGTYAAAGTDVLWLVAGRLLCAWGLLWTFQRLIWGRSRLPTNGFATEGASAESVSGYSMRFASGDATVIATGFTAVGVSTASGPGDASPELRAGDGIDAEEEDDVADDVSWGKLLVAAPACLALVLFGCAPQVVLDRTEPTVTRVLAGIDEVARALDDARRAPHRPPLRRAGRTTRTERTVAQGASVEGRRP